MLRCCVCVLLNFTACMLYYCNTVGWAWWDWGLIWWLAILLQCFDTVGWVTWPVKISSPNDLYCVEWDVKPYSTQIINSVSHICVTAGAKPWSPEFDYITEPCERVNPFCPVRRIYTSMRYPGRRTYTSWHRWFKWHNYTRPDYKCSRKQQKQAVWVWYPVLRWRKGGYWLECYLDRMGWKC